MRAIQNLASSPTAAQPQVLSEQIAGLLQNPEARLGLAAALQAAPRQIESQGGQALVGFLLARGNDGPWRDLKEPVSDAITRSVLTGLNDTDWNDPQAVRQAREKPAPKLPLLARKFLIDEAYKIRQELRSTARKLLPARVQWLAVANLT